MVAMSESASADRMGSRVYTRIPGAGYFPQSSFTSPAIFASPASSPGACVTRSIHSAIRAIASLPIPRVVTAGVPMRTPDGSNGFRGSNGTLL